jgi:hypothetical protein
MRVVFLWSLGACALAIGVACSGDDVSQPGGNSTSGSAGATSSGGPTSGTGPASTTTSQGVSTVGTGGAGPGGSGTGGTGPDTTGAAGAATGSGGSSSTGSAGSGSAGSTGVAGAAGSGAAGSSGTPDGGTAPRKIGGGCKSDADCDMVLGLRCDLKLPSGMCTKTCAGDLECGTTTLTGQHAANVCVMTECYRGCNATVPCVSSRTGYACIGTSPATYCAPGSKDGGP